MSWREKTEQIHARREAAKAQGGAESVAKHHAKGRLTVRERIDALIDPGTFDEIGRGAGDADLDENGNLIDFSPANFVLGFAKVDGRRVVVGGEDFTLAGGSPIVMSSITFCRWSLRPRVPCTGWWPPSAAAPLPEDK